MCDLFTGTWGPHTECCRWVTCSMNFQPPLTGLPAFDLCEYASILTKKYFRRQIMLKSQNLSKTKLKIRSTIFGDPVHDLGRFQTANWEGQPNARFQGSTVVLASTTQYHFSQLSKTSFNLFSFSILPSPPVTVY